MSASTCLCELGHPPWCADCQTRLQDQLAVAIAIADGDHPRYVIGHDDEGWCVVDTLKDDTNPPWQFDNLEANEAIATICELMDETPHAP